MSATLEVVDGVLRISVRFAPGIYSATASNVGIHFDTDENAATGASRHGLGADYLLYKPGPQSAGTGILRWNGTGYEGQPEVVQTTNVTDGVDFQVPLSRLGNDDGRFAFRIFVDDRALAEAEDWIPNLDMAPARLQ